MQKQAQIDRNALAVTTHHEGGHAVAALALGIPVENIRIYSSTYGRTRYGKVPGDGPGARLTTAKACIAGLVTEWVFRQRPFENFLDDANFILQHGGAAAEDVFQFNEEQCCSGIDGEEIVAQTHALIQSRWVAVAALAAVLEPRFLEACYAQGSNESQEPEPPILLLPGRDVECIVETALSDAGRGKP